MGGEPEAAIGLHVGVPVSVSCHASLRKLLPPIQPPNTIIR